MDIKAYIESGILEAYALGFASEAEVRDVQANLLQYPELREELQQIQEALNSNAVAYAKIPPADVKEKVYAKLFNESKEVQTAAIRTLPAWSRIAAVVAIVALGLNVILFLQWQNAREELAQLESEKSVFVNDFISLQVKYTLSKQQLAFFANPGIKPVVMKPVSNLASQSATVYWNIADGNLMVSLDDLPATPSGKQYQLWAIVDGQPVDLGVYNPGDTFQLMKQVAAPQAFAVTLEQKGGSPAPTMDQMVVMGEV